MTESVFFVALPEELAFSAVRERIGRREIATRNAGQSIVAILGVVGSVISIVQTPKTIQDFSTWISGKVRNRKEDVIIHVARDVDRKVHIVVAPGTDGATVAKLVEDALRPELPRGS